MKADLKRLHSPDVPDLRTFEPAEPSNFGIFVQAMIGPEGDDTFESFGFTVCTPSWLAQRVRTDGPVLGLHHVIVDSFDYEALAQAVASFCAQCVGASWQEIAPKVARLGQWEFDQYRE